MKQLAATIGRQKLSTKVTLMTVGALLLLSAVLFFGTRIMTTSSAREQGLEQLETNMRVAWAVMETQGSGFTLRDGTLRVGETALNGNDRVVDRIKHLVGGSATVFAGDMRVATNVTKDDGTRAIGTKLDAGPARDAVLGAGTPYRGETRILGKRYFAAYDPIRDTNGRIVGILYIGVPADAFYARVDHLGWQIFIAAALLTLIAAALCMRGARALFRPLESATRTMEALAQGDLSATVHDLDRADEIGDIARALEVFREAALAKREADREQSLVVESLAERLSRLSDGDLTASIAAGFPPAYQRLRENYNSALDGLRQLIGSATQSADSIRGGSHEIAQAADDLARRTESNAASLEQSSAALVQIDGRLKAGTQAASMTVERADQAIATVERGRRIAADAVTAMQRVSESAQDIDDVIEGLDKIAFQTRVLAMNAAVEAGRAGDAGRGFAVVADLVSELARRSEEEARSARQQLTVTSEEIQVAVGAVERVDGTFQGIAQDVEQVHVLLGGVARDNAASSGSLSEVAEAIGTMNLSTQQNAAMVEQTSAAARSLTEEVNRLSHQAAAFTIA